MDQGDFVDSESTLIDAAEKIGDSGLQFVHLSFSEFNLIPRTYDIINAQYSVPFIVPDDFPKVVSEGLGCGGVFVGNFFGLNDGWSKNENLFEGLNIIMPNESKNDRPIASGQLKYWHVYNVIAKHECP